MKEKRTSLILTELLQAHQQSHSLRFDQIVASLGDRAFGLVILFFALPSALPLSTIPGVSLIFSLPILMVAVQLLFQRSSLWLPARIARQTVTLKQLQQIVHKALPYLRWLEKLLRPRWSFFSLPLMEMITALVILFLSLLLMTPVPFTNFLFSSAIIILSLGLIEKDGLFIVLGFCLFILYSGTIYQIISSFLA